MSDQRLTFKEMCTKFDVTPRTLGITSILNCSPPKKKAAAGSTARARQRE